VRYHAVRLLGGPYRCGSLETAAAQTPVFSQNASWCALSWIALDASGFRRSGPLLEKGLEGTCRRSWRGGVFIGRGDQTCVSCPRARSRGRLLRPVYPLLEGSAQVTPQLVERCCRSRCDRACHVPRIAILPEKKPDVIDFLGTSRSGQSVAAVGFTVKNKGRFR